MEIRPRQATSAIGTTRTGLAWIIRFAAVMTLVACGTEATDPVEEADLCGAVSVALASGNEQFSRTGEALGLPVIVQATDPTGSPIQTAGLCVTWTVLSGGGTVSGPGVTDAAGSASGSWTLGPEEGLQKLEILVGSTGRVIATAVAIDTVRPIVYIEDPDASDVGGSGGQLHMMNVDGSGSIQIATGHSSSPRWSPDGSKIAFVRRFRHTCDLLQGDAMVIDLVSMRLTRLTDDGPCAVAEGLAWSPDGETLLLGRDGDIIEVDAETGAENDFASSPEREFRPAPGASGVAFSTQDPGEPVSALFDDLQGGGPEVILSGESDFFVGNGSVAQNRLVIFEKSPHQSLNYSLYLYDLTSEALVAVPGSQRGWSGTLSPDGTQLMVTLRASLPGGACSTSVGADYLVLIDLESGDQSDITAPCGVPSRDADWRPGSQ